MPARAEHYCVAVVPARAEHYCVAVVPARVRKPQDKSKVESAVQVVERWILARLRDRTFFSLAELNEAIAQLLEKLNSKEFQKLPGSRRSMFESLDKPALKSLPEQRYQYAEWKEVRVHMDYHVEVDKHYYSVPYQLVKKQLTVRMTDQAIECFYKGQRVASHQRSHLKGRHSTQASHMPEKHRKYAEWTPERLQNWAAQTGSETEAVIQKILAWFKPSEHFVLYGWPQSHILSLRKIRGTALFGLFLMGRKVFTKNRCF